MKHIPEEIVAKILTGFPFKSLFQFKCVSKPWLALISNIHLNFIRTQQRVAMVQHTLPAPSGFNPGQVQLVGCCNGLLFVNICKSFFLFNPITSYSKHIFSSQIWGYSRYHMYGLCYDPIKDDYLAVISTYPRTCAQVFRVKEGTLNVINLTNYWIDGENSGFVCNGRLHWLVAYPETSSRNVHKLICFDPMKEEGFREIDLPNYRSPRFVVGGCGVLWGSVLCLTVEDIEETRHVKVMAMWENSSWSTMLVISCELVLQNVHMSIKPLCFSKEGELIVLLGDSESKLVAYCPRKKLSRIVCPATEAITFMETVANSPALSAEKDWFIDTEIQNYVSLLSEFHALHSWKP